MAANSSDADALTSDSAEAILQRHFAELKSFITGLGSSLPDGWRVEGRLRAYGASKGTLYKLFVSPGGITFRSKDEVARTLGLLAKKKRAVKKQAADPAKGTAKPTANQTKPAGGASLANGSAATAATAATSVTAVVSGAPAAPAVPSCNHKAATLAQVIKDAPTRPANKPRSRKASVNKAPKRKPRASKSADAKPALKRKAPVVGSPAASAAKRARVTAAAASASPPSPAETHSPAPATRSEAQGAAGQLSQNPAGATTAAARQAPPAVATHAGPQLANSAAVNGAQKAAGISALGTGLVWTERRRDVVTGQASGQHVAEALAGSVRNGVGSAAASAAPSAKGGSNAWRKGQQAVLKEWQKYAMGAATTSTMQLAAGNAARCQDGNGASTQQLKSASRLICDESHPAVLAVIPVECKQMTGRFLLGAKCVLCECIACLNRPPAERAFSAACWEAHCGAAQSRNWKCSFRVHASDQIKLPKELGASTSLYRYLVWKGQWDKAMQSPRNPPNKPRTQSNPSPDPLPFATAVPLEVNATLDDVQRKPKRKAQRAAATSTAALRLTQQGADFAECAMVNGASPAPSPAKAVDCHETKGVKLHSGAELRPASTSTDAHTVNGVTGIHQHASAAPWQATGQLGAAQSAEVDLRMKVAALEAKVRQLETAVQGEAQLGEQKLQIASEHASLREKQYVEEITRLQTVCTQQSERLGILEAESAARMTKVERLQARNDKLKQRNAALKGKLGSSSAT